MPKAAGSPSLRSGGTHFSHSSGWCLFKQSDRSRWSSVSPSKKFQKKKSPKTTWFLYLALLSLLPQRQASPQFYLPSVLLPCPWLTYWMAMDRNTASSCQHCWVQVTFNMVLSQRPSTCCVSTKSQRRGIHLIYVQHVVATDFKGASPFL